MADPFRAQLPFHWLWSVLPPKAMALEARASLASMWLVAPLLGAQRRQAEPIGPTCLPYNEPSSHFAHHIDSNSGLRIGDEVALNRLTINRELG